MSARTISTPGAPAAIGPYAQAISVTAPARLIFCSGQIPLDPGTGEIVAPEDTGAQTAQVLKNLEAVLQAAGASLREVVKTTIYLVDLKDFGVVNEVYGRSFPANPPARATVQVAALPRGARVEIDAVAVSVA